MKTQEAIFAAGCFWHVQYEFDKIKGVVKTTVGYIGGDEKKYSNPIYELVHSGKTGHVEAVKVVFDPKIVSYEKLLEHFWDMHNPSTKNRQGMDFGTQYRAGIFYLSEEQKKLAEESKKKVEKKISPKKVYTFVKKAGAFHVAEEYHQKYFEKTGVRGCSI